MKIYMFETKSIEELNEFDCLMTRYLVSGCVHEVEEKKANEFIDLGVARPANTGNISQEAWSRHASNRRRKQDKVKKEPSKKEKRTYTVPKKKRK